MKNFQQLEQKIAQFADDTSVTLTSTESINELFKTLKDYEKATNAKINKEKTEGLWVGKWKNRTDKPHNLLWKNNHVKFLGIYIGNKVGASGTKLISDLNFAEHLEKVKNKINYWKGKGISLLGRVKVINIFILSRFWYRTEIISINSELLKTYEKLIRDFIWQDKQGGRVNQDVLQLSYLEGGLQLADIKTKTKTQRIKRIAYLMTLTPDKFQRFFADKLIGNSTRYKQKGLSFGLTTNKDRIKLIKNGFYKEVLTNFNELGIQLEPGNRRLIHNEPIFYSKFFTNSNGEHFLPDENSNNPLTIIELMKNREDTPNIREMKRTLNSIAYTSQNNNKLVFESNNEEKFSFDKLEFKNLYSELISRKHVLKHWEGKWEEFFLTNQQVQINDWGKIWGTVHSKINNPHIISAIWESLHLNYWSSFKANENCKICNEETSNNMHIVTECRILMEAVDHFKILNFISNKMILAFGCENELVNFVLYHLKKIIFRNRFKSFQNYNQAKNQIFQKCRLALQNDLEDKLFWAIKTKTKTHFENKFLFQTNFQLCQISDSNKIVLLI